MKRVVIYGFAVVAAVFAAADVSAQKYPERRMARDGNRLYEKGDFEGAEKKYRHALEQNPDLEDARFNLAGALFKQESVEAAAKIYMGFASDSTVTGERVADANYNLGNVMLAGQKIDDAIELYKQALRLNSGDMQAKYNLAYARKMKREQEENQNEKQDQDNQDQNQDENQDQNQNKDQNNQDQNQDQDKGDDREDKGDRSDQGDRPEPQGGESEASISPQEAEQILEAIQDEEDKTREKVNAKEVQAVGRSGKNW